MQVCLFGWFLPDTHALYKENLRSVFHVTTSSFMKHVESFKFCNGVVYATNPSFLKKHILYKVFNNADDYDQNDDPSLHSFNNIEYTRSMNCSLLTQSKDICLFCKSHLSFERKYVQNKKKTYLFLRN